MTTISVSCDINEPEKLYNFFIREKEEDGKIYTLNKYNKEVMELFITGHNRDDENHRNIAEKFRNYIFELNSSEITKIKKEIFLCKITNMKPNKTASIYPVMELYEYDIVGYSPDPTEKSSFGDIIDSPSDSCGKIKTKEYSGLIVNNGVCDSISSQDGGNYYDIDDFYANYKEWQTRIEIKEFTKTLPDEKITEINQLFDDAKNIMKNMISYNNEDMITQSYIYLLNAQTTDKIILFGDHHGSYHTFFRNLLRLHKFGVLNLDTFIINDGYKLIFIGDIVDRGAYALEIVYGLCKLIVNNNTDKNNPKILYNRGNHEEHDTASDYGFKVEMKKKANNKTILWEKFKDIILYFPSAVILNVDNQKRFWISHGGIPIDTKSQVNLEIKNEQIIWITDDNLENDIEDDDGFIIKKRSFNNIASHIRWNDFVPFNSTYTSKRGNDLFNVGKNYVKLFLDENNIDFIIRGHQDSYKNSFFYDKDGIVHYGLDATTETTKEDGTRNMFFLKNVTSSHRINKGNDNKIYGAKARFICDKNNFTGLPVITISTNTDYGRPLVKDSFAVLRFDLNKTKISFNETGDEIYYPKSVFYVQKTLEKNNISNLNMFNKKTIKIKSNVSGTIKITQKL